MRSNSEPGCKAASGGCPGGLGVSTETTSSMMMKLVAFSLGFWLRAPLGLIVVRHGRGVPSAPADESTCGERATMTETQPTRFQFRAAGVSGTTAGIIIGQNQLTAQEPATDCTSSSYHLRSFPKLLVQLRRRIAAIKGANPRHPQKQLQHHSTPWRSTGSSRRSSRRRSPSSRPPPRRRASQNCPRTSRAARPGAQLKFRGVSNSAPGRVVASTPSTRRLSDLASTVDSPIH